MENDSPSTYIPGVSGLSLDYEKMNYNQLNAGIVEDEMGIYTPEFAQAEAEINEELSREPADPDYVVGDEQAAANERELMKWMKDEGMTK
jgi:hypothetical protein